MAATYVLTVAGTVRKWEAGTLNIQEPANGIRTLQCDIISLDASVRPTRFQTVTLTENGTRIYGGIIVRAEERGLGDRGVVPIHTRISCQDYNQNAARRRINETFPAQSLKARLTTLVANYFAALGVTLDAGQVTGPTIDARQYSWAVGTKGTDVLTETVTLASAAGATDYIWRIDYNNVLSVFTPPTAPFSITTANKKAIGDVQPTPTLSDTYANTIICQGAVVTQTQRAETFAGTGAATVFTAAYTITNHYGYVIYDDGVNPPVYETLGTIPATWILDLATNTITDTGTGVTGYRSFPAAAGTTITFIFDGSSKPNATAIDAGEVAAHGIWEDVISPQNVLDTATAQALADAELEQRVVLPRTVQYRTYELGIGPAMFQTITVAERNLSGTFLTLNINTDEDGTTRQLIRTVTAVDTTKVRGLTHDLYLRWLGAGDTGSAPVASPTAISGLPAPPNRGVQLNKAGAFGAGRTLLSDYDDGGDVYGVEIATSVLAAIVEDEGDAIFAGARYSLVLGNRTAGLDKALTWWQTDDGDMFEEMDGSYFRYTNGEQRFTAGGLRVGVNNYATQHINLLGVTKNYGFMPGWLQITGNWTIDSGIGGGGAPTSHIYHLSASNHTLTLPALSDVLIRSSAYDRLLIVKNGGSGGTLTIAPTSANIETAANLVLQPNQCVGISPASSTEWKVIWGVGNIAVGGGGTTGTGDVVGPASSVDSEFALFNSTTGKLIKRATGTGFAYATSGVYSVVTLDTDLALAAGVLSTQAGIRKATVTLTDAQIKALPSTPITIVSAPGAGKRIAIDRVEIDGDFDNGVYTNIDANDAGVNFQVGNDISSYLVNDNTDTPARTQFSDFFATAKRNTATFLPKVLTSGNWGVLVKVLTDIGGVMVNTPLTLFGWNTSGGNLTGGNAANYLKVTAYYTVETV